MRIERDGDHYVLNGRKWWTTGALHPNCRILIAMGKTDPDAPVHEQQSMVLVALDTPGVTVERSTTVFGYTEPEGHGVAALRRRPRARGEHPRGRGRGLHDRPGAPGPGRIHHCMRSIGAAERALELLCERADARETFGRPVSANANVRDWIAESRIEIEMARLLVDEDGVADGHGGNRQARTEIAGIKFAVPQICLRVVDRAIQVHGGGGISDDFPLAHMYARPALAAARRRPRRGPQALGRPPGAAPPARTPRGMSIELRDGSRIVIRPIEPGDRAALAEGFLRLSPESRYRRFFGPVAELSDRQLDYFTGSTTTTTRRSSRSPTRPARASAWRVTCVWARTRPSRRS